MAGGALTLFTLQWNGAVALNEPSDTVTTTSYSAAVL